jgi:hypothetical protein
MVVPLEKMAEVSEAEKLVRTTLYIVSPALARPQARSHPRSRLYNHTHDHLFRPNPKPKAESLPLVPDSLVPDSLVPDSLSPQNQLKQEQENAKK